MGNHIIQADTQVLNPCFSNGIGERRLTCYFKSGECRSITPTLSTRQHPFLSSCDLYSNRFCNRGHVRGELGKPILPLKNGGNWNIVHRFRSIAYCLVPILLALASSACFLRMQISCQHQWILHFQLQRSVNATSAFRPLPILVSQLSLALKCCTLVIHTIFC